MFKLFVVYNCLVCSLCYTGIPGTELLVFGVQLKANCPLFVPSSINQAAPPDSTADKQFKCWDDLCFLQTFPTAIHLLNSSKENQATRFRQKGMSISKQDQ